MRSSRRWTENSFIYVIIINLKKYTVQLCCSNNNIAIPSSDEIPRPQLVLQTENTLENISHQFASLALVFHFLSLFSQQHTHRTSARWRDKNKWLRLDGEAHALYWCYGVYTKHNPSWYLQLHFNCLSQAIIVGFSRRALSQGKRLFARKCSIAARSAVCVSVYNLTDACTRRVFRSDNPSLAGCFRNHRQICTHTPTLANMRLTTNHTRLPHKYVYVWIF